MSLELILPLAWGGWAARSNAADSAKHITLKLTIVFSVQMIRSHECGCHQKGLIDVIGAHSTFGLGGLGCTI
jgi:hypothetical protein